jgi:predicted transcriptional regulator
MLPAASTVNRSAVVTCRLALDLMNSPGFVGKVASRSKRRKDVAIPKLPPTQPKNETLQIRVEGQIKAKLDKYAEFINSSESYVVSEALRLLFRKDEEFKNWLKARLQNGDQLENGLGSRVETVKTT